MSVLRTAILIVIFVIGAAGLVTAARLLPRLLAHARVTWPAAPSRRLAPRARVVGAPPGSAARCAAHPTGTGPAPYRRPPEPAEPDVRSANVRRAP
jgi:hypothetical protein